MHAPRPQPLQSEPVPRHVCDARLAAWQVGLDVIDRCFKSKIAAWTPKLKEMIPSYGQKLNSDARMARENMAYTAEALELWGSAAGTRATADAEKLAVAQAAAQANAEKLATAEAAAKAAAVQMAEMQSLLAKKEQEAAAAITNGPNTNDSDDATKAV